MKHFDHTAFVKRLEQLLRDAMEERDLELAAMAARQLRLYPQYRDVRGKSWVR